MASRLHQSINTLRSLPLGTRHAILWGGSLLLFFFVFSLWVIGVKSRFEVAFQTFARQPLAVQKPLSPPAKSVTQTKRSTSQLAQILELLKGGSSGFLSLFKRSTDSPQEPYREGGELQEFLKYQQEFYRGFPQNE